MLALLAVSAMPAWHAARTGCAPPRLAVRTRAPAEPARPCSVLDAQLDFAGHVRAARAAPRCTAQMRAPDELADPYAVLKVPRGCTVEEARRAFRLAARRVHPDVCDAPDAAAQFIRVKAAFDAVHRRAERATAKDSTPGAAHDVPRPVSTEPEDMQDMESFVRAMEEQWVQSRSEAHKRWKASEAWKEREFQKHKRSKGKRKAATSRVAVGAPTASGKCVRRERKPNWRGGGRIKP